MEFQERQSDMVSIKKKARRNENFLKLRKKIENG